MKRRILALLVAGAVAFAVTGCNSADPLRILGETTTVNEQTTTAATTAEQINTVSNANFSAGRSTQLSLNADGTLGIARKSRSAVTKMGADGWTVFVYLCGTDLESGDGSACGTLDLDEMIEASSMTDALRFVVETGGTKQWNNDLVDASQNQRFLISGGEITLVDSVPLSNMGSADTLAAFLSWGVENYASSYMGVTLWNHGGGSITGVCFDELADYDSLSLQEIENAFDSVFDKMTDKFEFIGFDACLMSTVETANILQPHARYMYASQELESGYGWDYTAMGTCLSGNPSADGAELGKYVCDGYYSSCESSGEDGDATLSVTDLEKLDAFLASFNEFSNELYSSAQDNQTLVQVLREIGSVENYGGNNRNEGYTNMVDLGGIIENSASVIGSDKANAALNALDACTVYSVKGYNKPNGHGLSVYYPLSVQGSEEISTFKNIAISPYYISFIDLVAYGSSSSGDVSGYDDSDWLGDGSSFWSDDTTADDSSWTDYWGSDEEGDSGYEYNFDAGATSLNYSVYPYLTDDGYYTFTLDENSIYYCDRIYCNVMMSYYSEDGTEYMLDLGTDDYVSVDWDTGVVTDNFDGYWFSLPDGQPLTCYLVEQNSDYNVYSAPIYLNDEITNLRIIQRYYDDYYTTEIAGVWAGVSDNGSVDREVTKLKNGDRIAPCYYAYDAQTGEFYDYFYGDDYTYTGSDEITESVLYEGDYYYGFEIYDVFENALYTDFVLFGVEANGDIYFYDDTASSDDSGWGWGNYDD